MKKIKKKHFFREKLVKGSSKQINWLLSLPKSPLFPNSGGVQANSFAEIRLILGSKFGNHPYGLDLNTAWKVSRYGPEKTPYLDIFMQFK